MQVDTQHITAGMHPALTPELQGPFRGPLFKELFGEFPDVDPAVTEVASPAGVSRSGLYAHTTDIQFLDQFLGLKDQPARQGTAYHHKQYVHHLPDSV